MKNLLLLVILAQLLLFSCRKDREIITEKSAKLSFSVDTMRFDTVFTTVGSATRYFKVFNEHDQPIEIEKIEIANSQSIFRLNVDGIVGNNHEKIQIPANDSIYVFAEVTVDPDQPLSDSPFVINDELRFLTNGNEQIVTLEAWGQNANYIPNRYGNGGIALMTCNLGEIIWDDPKPYVIYGVLAIDSCQLTLPAGTHIYIHGGVQKGENNIGESFYYNDGLIIVSGTASIVANGTALDSIIIEGDRLEEDYFNKKGQWSGISIYPDSKGNIFNYTTIKNSNVGIQLDSASEASFKNCKILNTSGSGIVGFNAKISAENCLFANNGGNSVSLNYGGNYTFDYCTLANYGGENAALKMTNIRCLDALCSSYTVLPLIAKFRNSIIFGSKADELDLFDGIQDGSSWDYEFRNCYFRVNEMPTEEGNTSFFDHTFSSIKGSPLDNLFMDTENGNYHLDTLTKVEKMAAPILTITKDLDGQIRDLTIPDIGCYEYVY